MERNGDSQKSLEALAVELKDQLKASVPRLQKGEAAAIRKASQRSGAEAESLEAFAVKQDEVVMSAFKESFHSGFDLNCKNCHFKDMRII